MRYILTTIGGSECTMLVTSFTDYQKALLDEIKNIEKSKGLKETRHLHKLKRYLCRTDIRIIRNPSLERSDDLVIVQIPS